MSIGPLDLMSFMDVMWPLDLIRWFAPIIVFLSLEGLYDDLLNLPIILTTRSKHKHRLYLARSARHHVRRWSSSSDGRGSELDVDGGGFSIADSLPCRSVWPLKWRTEDDAANLILGREHITPLFKDYTTGAHQPRLGWAGYPNQGVRSRT